MASDEKRTRRLQKRFQEEDERSRIDGMLHLLSTSVGRRFLWMILEDCRVNGQPFSTNDRVTAFNCGELNVGRALQAMIFKAKPDAFLVMMKENEEHARSRAEASSALAESFTGTDADSS